MGYYEFTITVSDKSKDALLDRMSEMGCLGVTDYGNKVIAYFKDGSDVTTLRDELNSFKKVLKESSLDHDFTFDYFYLAERDWNESWKKRFIPIDAGERFSILPPWEVPNNNRTPLIIDPGMAFGTGHHETTKTCLMLMERYSKESRRESFLDVGTGTGILAIAASMLGFTHVIGVDIDPLAVDAAKRNAELNHLANIEVRKGSISHIHGTFDMIAANLMSEILIRMAAEIASHLKKPGIAILSGMLVGQEDDVIRAVENVGLRVAEKYYDGRWVSVIVKHKIEDSNSGNCHSCNLYERCAYSKDYQQGHTCGKGNDRY
ncbi:MAG: 50S ribosomal protein L11 methyltransferase [Nitrospirae bacterium]|nr:50S ribosomal protein L11 methyltransferase [Nitrospirota bacterium]MCL5421140.1 50S ribosomal protein L11 methyltransferase [Nitrospirota bacterium]